MTAGGSTPHFADRLAALVEERRSRVVLGLDPDPAALWPEAVERVGGDPGAARLARAHTAEAVTEHCRAAIVAAGPACVAVKPQLACFERLGAPGWEALEQVVAIARDHGLLVIADGKRGDVPVTARAYAQALVGETPGPFGPVQGLGADAFTANPLLGRDSLEPLVDAAAVPAPAASCSSAPPTPAPPSSRTRASRRCTSGSRGSWTSWAASGSATAGCRSWVRSRAPPGRGTSAACAS